MVYFLCLGGALGGATVGLYQNGGCDEDGNDDSLDFYVGTSTKPFNWICPVCDEHFMATIHAMIRAYNTESHGCPICSRKKVRKTESFAALFPELMKEYSPTFQNEK